MKLNKEQIKMIPLYTYRIEWSEEDRLFIVSVEELPGCMSHGSSQAEALEMGHEAVRCHIEGMAKDGVEIPKPFGLEKYKGDFVVRATPELHRKLAIESARQGFRSFNKFLIHQLKNSLDRNKVG
jgi:predicted RNase H-like HicB family nuclease